MANTTRLRKSAIGTFYIYFVFLICFFPLILTVVVSMVVEARFVTNLLFFYAMTLAFFNSSLNPLIYCWKMRHIRHAIMDVLQNLFIVSQN